MRSDGNDGQAADEFGDQAEVKQVFGLDLFEDVHRRIVEVFLRGVGVEAEGVAAETALDDVLESDEGAAADEEDLLGVDLDVFLLRMLAAALRRDVADGALEDLEQGLLHAFAGDVAGDRDVLGLAADLVDLVDVDDAALGACDVEIGGLEQAEDDVFHVLADVAGLGERGGIDDAERHVEHPGQRAGEQGLAGTGRAEQQDVGLLDFHVR